MKYTRRRFIAGIGAAILLAGPARLLLAKQQSRAVIRYGMLHDETRCIGCSACMDACRTVNRVPDGVSRLQILRSEPIGDFPEVRYLFYRHSCQHCDQAPCVEVCPTGASFRDSATGIVDVNPDLCVGCQYCIAACPYQVRFIHPVSHTADKCDFCRKTNLAIGKLPACVLACPTQALTFGDLDNPNGELRQILAQRLTYRAKLTLGTQPKLYRIPAGIGEITA